jgi:hypothetical protein
MQFLGKGDEIAELAEFDVHDMRERSIWDSMAFPCADMFCESQARILYLTRASMQGILASP